MEGKLFAGCGRADITPEVGGHLYGYSNDIFSTAVHDRLDAKALALSDGVNPPLLLISISICELGTPFAPEVRVPVAEACGTTPERVLLSGIHNHTGPNVAGLGTLWGSRDKPYFDSIFVPGIVEAAKQAVASLAPAEYAVAKGQTEIGVNRRERKLNGKVKLGQNPWGPQDKDMIFVHFRNRETKESIFRMVYYGCHGTAAGHAQVISRDWAGIMLDRLEERYGVTTALWCGSIGDVGPRLPNGKTTGDVAMMEELGGFAAQEAVRIAASLDTAAYETGALCFRPTKLHFDVRPMPPEAEIDAYLQSLEGEPTKKTAGLKANYMRRCKQRYETGEKSPESRDVEAAVVTLGDAAAFCFTPFELFSETTLMLRKYSPYRFTMGVSVTNGFEKYLPTQTEQVRGGYEVSNYKFAEAPLQADADFVLLHQFLDVLADMHGDPPFDYA
ncbi:MAG: neutral/alkaline non-lysosomal ceramidase N-terminal domain-containing protein [Oscillospiraceae bacterium]|nr:neutral/alkaline non-lysosomal ceramidase N-terminal domain-containing protein [Oscillospiraceae bacterium]